jgi:hypothetical protein
MSDEKDEALARQLWALHQEALGGAMHVSIWDEALTSIEREAWVQVAQFVDARQNEATKQLTDFMEHCSSKYAVYEPDHK